MIATKSLLLQIIITLILLAVTISIFEYTSWDLEIQNKFYTPQLGWLISDNDFWLWVVFYKGIKICIVIFAITMLGFYIKTRRREPLLLILAIILVPLIVATAKKFTNIYCPDVLEYFGGSRPYVRVFDSYPLDYLQMKKANCYPAGHASGGFALLALFFVFKKRSYRYCGLATGLALGWIMGFYQIARGVHFFSDTMMTMLVAWLVILVLRFCIFSAHPAA